MLTQINVAIWRHQATMGKTYLGGNKLLYMY